jgi:hypothetical protein
MIKCKLIVMHHIMFLHEVDFIVPGFDVPASFYPVLQCVFFINLLTKSFDTPSESTKIIPRVNLVTIKGILLYL